MYRLPDRWRERLAQPWGEVITDPEIPAVIDDHRAIAVGDVTTRSLIRAGVVPWIAVLDGVTRRGDLLPVPEGVAWARRLRVANPAGTLTDEMVRAVRDCLGAAGPSLIEVEGEEDLASLLMIDMAPEGTRVCYGIPGRGIAVVSVDGTMRSEVRTILCEMEVDQDGD